jgi:PIN domain nuclease of toxin-antitoxin system
MIVVDTHAWIWWKALPEMLSARARKALHSADRVGIPAISLWELAMLAKRGRIAIEIEPRAWMEEALDDGRSLVLPITPHIATTALDRDLHGDPADRLIAATALSEGAVLITKDAKLAACPGLQTLW